MDIEEELLQLIEGAASGPPQDHDELTPLDLDPMATEVYSALKAAEVDELKKQLRKLIAIHSPMELSESPQVTSMVPIESITKSLEQPPTSVDHSCMRPSAISAEYSTAVKAIDIVDPVSDIAECVRERLISYTAHNTFELTTGVQPDSVVVYWVAPGMARCHNNAALELSIDCARALNLPLIAMSCEKSMIYDTMNDVLNASEPTPGSLLGGLHRKRMFRISKLVKLAEYCSARNAPMLSMSYDETSLSIVQVFQRLIHRISSQSSIRCLGKLFVFTEHTSHVMHHMQCISLLSHFKTEKIMLHLYGVAFGDIIDLKDIVDHSMLGGSNCSVSMGVDKDVKILELDEFCQAFDAACHKIIDQSTSNYSQVTAGGSNSCMDENNNRFVHLLSDEHLSATLLDNKSALGVVISSKRWLVMRKALDIYLQSYHTELAAVSLIPTVGCHWGDFRRSPVEALRLSLSELFRHYSVLNDLVNNVIDHRSSIESLRGETFSIRGGTAAILTVSSCIQAIIDLGITAREISHRDILREILLFPLLEYNAGMYSTSQAVTVWKRIRFYFLTAEYQEYCVRKGVVSDLYNGNPNDVFDMTASCTQTLSISAKSSWERVFKLNILPDVLTPQQIFSASSKNAVFNALQCSLMIGTVIPRLKQGTYWFMFLLKSLPTIDIAIRTALSELALHSLVDEDQAMQIAYNILSEIIVCLFVDHTTSRGIDENEAVQELSMELLAQNFGGQSRSAKEYLNWCALLGANSDSS